MRISRSRPCPYRNEVVLEILLVIHEIEGNAVIDELFDKKDDTIVIKSIERLGCIYNEIIEQ